MAPDYESLRGGARHDCAGLAWSVSEGAEKLARSAIRQSARERPAEVKRAMPAMGIVDLASGRTVTRRGLVTEILNEIGGYCAKIASGEDLAVLERVLESKTPSLLALKHFDLASRPKRRNNYCDLYFSLRYLVMERRQLTLIIHARAPFASLLPSDSALSYLEMETVELGL
jgi:hypothetical protein